MQANTFAVTAMGRHLKSRPVVVGIIGAILVGLLAGQAMAVTSITDVNVANKPDRVVVSVHGSAPLRMAVLSSSSGRYLGFQFAGRLVSKGRLVSIHGGRICNVRYSRFQENPPLARVVLNTSSHLDYSTDWSDDRTQVGITVWKYGASPDAAPHEPSFGAKPIKATRSSQPAADLLPMLPPMEFRGPQGSEPGKVADPVSAMPKAAPMQVVRVAPAPTPVVRAAPAPMQVVRVAPAMVRVARTPAMPAAFGAGKKVSLNFLGADIADVLKALAVQSGENIVVGSDVTGAITVTLDTVTVEEALDYITQLSGYTYVKDQHTFLVGSTGTVGGLVNAKVEIVTLAYANADDVLEMLKVQCPQVRTTKISVRGGTARVHKQELRQGKSAESGSGASSGAGAPAPAAATPGQAEGQPSAPQQAAKGLEDKQIQDITQSIPPQSEKTPTSNMIALVGSPEKVAAAKVFINQVEDAMRNQAAETKISAYSVKYVNTWELANTLMSLVLGVNVALGPSDESGPISSMQASGNLIRNVPANLLSGEDTHRPYYDYQNTNATVPNSHTLIIVGKALDVQKALDTAAQFDVPGDTDLATYKVKYVEINTLAGALRKLVPGATVTGIDVPDGTSIASGSATPGASQSASSGSGGSGSQGTTSTNMSAAALDNLSRTLVITGRKGDVGKARTLIEALDIKSPQIRIEAKITSLTETGEKKLGLSWSWGDFVKNEVSPSHWQRQPWDFAATLDALITTGDGKLLAAPSLVCLEGKPGQFFVGDQIRFVTQISVGNNGAPTVTTDTANVGVQLSVVGNVSSDGNITLNLHPEVSVVRLDKVQASGIALTLPTITRRYTDHVVRVKNGETIVIGGLISDQDLDTLNKIPILGDLPILGHLFRHRDKTKDHSEVVIFITASIVND